MSRNRNVVHARAKGWLILRPVCGVSSVYPQKMTRDEREVTCGSCLRTLAGVG